MPVSSSARCIRFAVVAAFAGTGLAAAGLAARAIQATSTPPGEAAAAAAATAAPAAPPATDPLLGFSPAHAAEARAVEARCGAAMPRE